MPEPPDEEDKRTTPIGLFNYAESFWRAAAALQTRKLRTTHPQSPVLFLYYHAIELYLKAYLRFHGHSVKALKKLGHSMGVLAELAIKKGLSLDDEDHTVIALAHPENVLGSRYIRTGPFTVPTSEALNRTCKSLRESIGLEMRRNGQPIRLPAKLPPSRRR